MNIECDYEYFESAMNGKHVERFETIESMATFKQKNFLDQIKHNLKYYGMTVDSLAKSISISSFRMSALINNRADFEPYEVQIIKKRLHIK